MLAMAEYEYNNSKHSSTKKSPFNANYGFEPHLHGRMDIQFKHPELEMYGN